MALCRTSSPGPFPPLLVQGRLLFWGSAVRHLQQSVGADFSLWSCRRPAWVWEPESVLSHTRAALPQDCAATPLCLTVLASASSRRASPSLLPDGLAECVFPSHFQLLVLVMSWCVSY